MSASDHSAYSFKLSKWQKRQAALLYYFASSDYLEQLIVLVKALRDSVDQHLTTAQQQGHDQFLQSDRWGVRDTAANYSTHGFPGIEDFLQSLQEDLILRDIERYRDTGYNDFSRRINELSLNWMTLEEEQQFQVMHKVIAKHASKLDSLIGKRWNNSSMYNIWKEYSVQFPRLPKFIVHTDRIAETQQIPPPCTGVYVSQDDPNGTLQFAWRGCGPEWDKYGGLADMQTFNEFGLDAVKSLGQDLIWTESPKVLEFVKQPQYLDGYVARARDYYGDEDPLSNLESPPAYIASQAFTSHPTKWYYVELVEGEYESEEDAQADFDRGTRLSSPTTTHSQRCAVSENRLVVYFHVVGKQSTG